MLAVRNGADYLQRTLEAIAAQSVAPERVVAVDARSTDASRRLLDGADVALVDAPSTASYVDAIRAGVASLPAAEEGDWLWFLAHDAVPHDRALEMLLATVETSPSVAVVGPKVMRAAEPDTFAEYGQTMTPLGRSVRLHDGELDQGQHDGDSDALGVAESGVLVRRDVLEALGGLDPALPSVDAGLDLGVRARLAGHRVALQPAARVRRAGGPEHFRLRHVSDARRTRIGRAAQLHRRLAYAAAVLVPLHWLALLPLALVRSIGHVLAKRPGSIPAEWAAAAAAAVRLGRVARARRRIRRTRVARWRDLRPLRVSWRALREHRQRVGDDVDHNARVVDERVGFVEGAGLWVAALAAVVGVLVLAPLIGAGALTGGALLPLDATVGGLWADATWGVRDGVGDVVGPADGFAILVAALGTLAPWMPSASVIVVLVLVLAAPLAAIAAWWFVRSCTTSRWMPTAGAAAWAFAPALLLAVHEGRLGAVVAHVLLPVAAGCALRASASWRATGGAALALAAVAAGAPSLLPALLVGVLGVAAASWRSPRVLLAAVPALLLVGPTVVTQWLAGTPLHALADPGVPLASPPATPLQLLLGMPEGDLGGVGLVADALGFEARWLAIALAAPLLVLAVLGPILRLRALVGIGIAALGLATAIGQTHVAVASTGTEVVTVWAGSGVSLMLLGLLVAATRAVDALEARAGIPISLVTLVAALGAAPAVVLGMLAPALEAAPERALPAFVVADADADVGTLVLAPLDDGTIAARIERGAGSTLTDASTLVATAPVGPQDEALATVAANLVAGGGDVDGRLDDWSVRYVLLADGDASLGDVVESSLSERDGLETIGETTFGVLWQRDVVVEPAAAPSTWAALLLAGQLLALGIAIVLALPSARRGARVRSRRAKIVKDWA